MALKIWLPLNKDARNVGLNNVNVRNNHTVLTTGGIYTNCYSFNGVDNNLSFIPQVDGLSSISVALWLCPSSNTPSGAFFSLERETYWQVTMYYNSISIRDDSIGYSGSRKDFSTGNYTANTWTHLAIVYDRGTLKIYRDGALLSTNSVGGTKLNTGINGGRIGSAVQPNYYYSGKINDVRVYDNALNEEDIKRIYNCKIMDIVATKYNNGFFYDNSGVLINKLVSTGVTYSGNSMYFNGSSTASGSQIRPKDGTSGLNISGGTLSIWFTPLSKPNDYRIIYIDSKSHFAIGFYSSGNLFLCQCNGVQNASFSTSNIQYGQINNAIIGYATNGKPQYCYINGIKASTGTSDCWTETGGLTIGGRTANTANKFNGYISRVTVYRNQLTEDEAKKLYAIGPQTETDFSQNYTRLEYIQSNSAQTTYINTGLKSNNLNENKLKIEIDGNFGENSTQWRVDGCSNGKTRYVGLNTSSKLSYGNNGDVATTYQETDLTGRHLYSVDYMNGTLKRDNTIITSFTPYSNSTYEHNLFIFTWRVGGTVQKNAKKYDVKFYFNNNIAFHGIPAKRNIDNVVGLYDVVSKTFFTNVGSGYFIAGPEFGTKLPSAYQQVEYLESADGANCYINTNFKPNNNTRLTTTVYPTSDNTSAHFYFGSRNGSSTSQAFGVYQSGNKASGLYALWNNSGNISLGSNFSGQKKYYIDLDKNVLTINGVVAKTFTNGTFTGTYNVFLFAMNTTGSMDSQKGGQRMEITRIYDNGILVRNMIPCYRKSDNVKGMYDTVNNVFYTNAGSGTFIAGPEI